MMSVGKWVLSALFVSMVSQLAFAGDPPISVNAVLVPSDAACNSCSTREPLYVNSFGVGLYPVDDSCRKCESSVDRELKERMRYIDEKDAQDEKKRCDTKVNELLSALDGIQDARNACSEPALDKTRAWVEAALDYGRTMARGVINNCTPVYQKQSGENKQLYGEAIQIAATAMRNIDKFERESLKQDPDYCLSKK